MLEIRTGRIPNSRQKYQLITWPTYDWSLESTYKEAPGACRDTSSASAALRMTSHTKWPVSGKVSQMNWRLRVKERPTSAALMGPAVMLQDNKRNCALLVVFTHDSENIYFQIR